MKKVMFILHTYSVGGAERRCLAVANYLATKGVKVKIVLLDINKMYVCQKEHNGLEIDIQLVESPNTEIPANNLVEIVYLLHKDEAKILSDKIQCVEYADSYIPCAEELNCLLGTTEKIEKVKKQLSSLENLYVDRLYNYIKDFPDYRIISWMTFCNLATAVALKELPNEFAFVECTSPDIEFPSDGAINYLKKLYYPRAGAGFFQTEEICDFYDFLPNMSKYIIPNPILFSFPERYNGVRKKRIVNFCRIEKTKNLDLLIDAFEMFRRYHPDYCLYIIGDGSEKHRLKEKANRRNIAGCVHFLPFDSNVHKKVLDFSMFVSSSNREGISNSMLEAMAMGLPTICTDCYGGGAKAIIVDGENGLLVPMNNKEALCNAMRKIVEVNGLSDSLSKNASKICDSLSISEIGNKWLKAVTEEWYDVRTIESPI